MNVRQVKLKFTLGILDAETVRKIILGRPGTVSLTWVWVFPRYETPPSKNPRAGHPPGRRNFLRKSRAIYLLSRVFRREARRPSWESEVTVMLALFWSVSWANC